MTEPDYEKWTDEQLQANIDAIQQDTTNHQKHIDVNARMIARLQAELDRRELAAYWQAHPELTRLEVGDKLLITAWYNASYGQIHPELTHHSPIGSTSTVKKIYMATFGERIWRVECINDVDGSRAPGIPLVTALQLRRAYLDAHESEETK